MPLTRATLEKALAGRRAAKARRDAEAAANTKQRAAAEARKRANHERDPRVKLYRREARRRGDVMSAPIAEAKAAFDRFWENERERRKGGRPKSTVSRHPDVRGGD